MKRILLCSIPLGIGMSIATLLNVTVGWWGFWVIFPWIGFSITVGSCIREFSAGTQKLLGRKVSLLMIMPCLLFFVPIINNENFQLEGIVLIVAVGFFSKGFIHYAIAKIFGPLIWGRGFCGWACWTAAVLEWLPIRRSAVIPAGKYRYLRAIALLISVAVPLYMIFALNFNVRTEYINRVEMLWMFAGNALYYAIGIPLALIMKDKRAFCKMVCPVSLIMMPSTRISAIKIRPKKNDCIGCGKCSAICPMGIDVMSYIQKRQRVTSPECILCGDCRMVCPVKAI